MFLETVTLVAAKVASVTDIELGETEKPAGTDRHEKEDQKRLHKGIPGEGFVGCNPGDDRLDPGKCSVKPYPHW